MNIRRKIKETVAKIVTEKKARKLAESNVTRDQISRKYNEMYGKNPNTTAADVAKALGITDQEVMMVIFTPTTYGGNKLSLNNLNEDHEVSMAQSSLDSIIRSATELKTKIGNNEIDIPAWIQDHITNSETYIDQASQGYHEYSNGSDNEGAEMNEFNLGHNETASIEQEGPYWIVTYKTMDGTKEKVFKSEDEAKKFFKTLNESQQELDEAMIRRWQHYAGIK
jgi:hypothetical protein